VERGKAAQAVAEGEQRREHGDPAAALSGRADAGLGTVGKRVGLSAVAYHEQSCLRRDWVIISVKRRRDTPGASWGILTLAQRRLRMTP
jgi:hypothetical protein